ncbi:hypothetical protein [Candidatus Clostridium helianthi]|jgi:hypothetical protein|uniref:Uncharacterized protein n=1 Tax=Candidatus Clostridium helianthi TaxID=3381660 RepID=A0ABW8S3W7_9CLOT
MDEKVRQTKREYMREWRKRNKDKVRAAQERYWEKKAMESTNNKEGGIRA